MTTWVLLRGLARETGHWNGFETSLAARLGAGHDVVALDLPGNGSRWQESSPWSVPGLVDACDARLTARGKAPPYVLVAMSLGAMVALDWAHRFPARIAGVVIINTSARGAGAPWQRLRPSGLWHLMGLLRPGLTTTQREARVLALTSSEPQRHAPVVARWAEYARLRPVRVENVLRQLVAAARYKAPASAPPTRLLMLASEGDRLVSPDCSRRLAGRWRLAMQMHPTAGHDLPLDDPDWVLEKIEQWWQSAPETKTPTV